MDRQNHQATDKELRQFGLLVGGVFAVIGLWPVVFERVTPPMGNDSRWPAHCFGCDSPARLEACSPEVDADRACSRFDQHEDYLGDRLLWSYHTHGACDATDG